MVFECYQVSSNVDVDNVVKKSSLYHTACGVLGSIRKQIYESVPTKRLHFNIFLIVFGLKTPNNTSSILTHFTNCGYAIRCQEDNIDVWVALGPSQVLRHELHELVVH